MHHGIRLPNDALAAWEHTTACTSTTSETSITDELVIHQPHSILEAPIQGILPHLFVALTIWVVFSPIYLKNIGSILPMYRSCFLVGLPRFFYLDNSLQSPKLSLLLRPPPHWRRSQRGWITRGC